MWEGVSPVFKSKVRELTGTFQTFFMYKVADKIGTRMMQDNHGNELSIMFLLLASMFMVLFVWEQIGEVLYEEIAIFHKEAGHDRTKTDLITGGPESQATILGWVFAPTTLFRSLLMAIVVWLGQMFSVVVGNYVTTFADNSNPTNMVPLTLAIGSFLFLAKSVIMPEPKRRQEQTHTDTTIAKLLADPDFLKLVERTAKK
jgi:hypothetical protein